MHSYMNIRKYINVNYFLPIIFINLEISLIFCIIGVVIEHTNIRIVSTQKKTILIFPLKKKKSMYC